MRRLASFCSLVLLLPTAVIACGSQARTEASPDGFAQVQARSMLVMPPMQSMCSIGAEGTIGCARLGTYSAPTPLMGQPLPAPALSGVTSISGRNAHACASADGAVYCWGQNNDLSAGEEPAVVGLEPAVAVSAGRSHSCAIVDSGGVSCWGSNDSLQLAAQDLAQSQEPVEVAGLTGVQHISAGGSHTCALLGDGAIACWGDNSFLQLGTADVTRSSEPLVLDRFASALDAGLSSTCIVNLERAVQCWGRDLDSQAYTFDARLVPGTEGTVDVVVGREHACALSESGSVSCWGSNALAQLGVSGAPSRQEAEPVAGLNDVVAIAAGGDLTCARRASGEHLCWGGFTGAPMNGFPAGS